MSNEDDQQETITSSETIEEPEEGSLEVYKTKILGESKNVSSFVGIGKALHKLYYQDRLVKNQREFLDWTKRHLGFSKSTTYEYIISYKIYSEIAAKLPADYRPPMYQSHCQLLSKIPGDMLVETWMGVCDASAGASITTAFLENFLGNKTATPKQQRDESKSITPVGRKTGKSATPNRKRKRQSALNADETDAKDDSSNSGPSDEEYNPVGTSTRAYRVTPRQQQQQQLQQLLKHQEIQEIQEIQKIQEHQEHQEHQEIQEIHEIQEIQEIHELDSSNLHELEHRVALSLSQATSSIFGSPSNHKDSLSQRSLPSTIADDVSLDRTPQKAKKRIRHQPSLAMMQDPMDEYRLVSPPRASPWSSYLVSQRENVQQDDYSILRSLCSPYMPFSESLIYELGKTVVLGQQFDIIAKSPEEFYMIEQQPWFGRLWCNLSGSRPFSTASNIGHQSIAENGGLERLLQIIFTKFANKEFVEGLFMIRAEFGADWFTPIIQHPFCIIRHISNVLSTTADLRFASSSDSKFESYVVFYLGPNVTDFCSVFRSVGLVPGINSWSAVPTNNSPDFAISNNSTNSETRLDDSAILQSKICETTMNPRDVHPCQSVFLGSDETIKPDEEALVVEPSVSSIDEVTNTPTAASTPVMKGSEDEAASALCDIGRVNSFVT